MVTTMLRLSFQKQKIMKIGKFTEIQYESIVNMRLRNIAKLEEQKINEESINPMLDEPEMRFTTK